MENISVYSTRKIEDTLVSKEEITFHQVSAAADMLYAAGEMPSAVKLQKTLSSGSLTDIAKHLKTWTDLKSPNPGVLDSTAPPAVSLAVQDVVLHTHNDSPNATLLDSVMTQQEPRQTHSAMQELVKENQILTEKVIALTAEKDLLLKQLKKLKKPKDKKS
jgi:hypothetical protein